MRDEIANIRKLLVCELCELVNSNVSGDNERFEYYHAKDLKQDLTAAVDRVLKHVAAEIMQAEVAAVIRQSLKGGAE